MRSTLPHQAINVPVLLACCAMLLTMAAGDSRADPVQGVPLITQSDPGLGNVSNPGPDVVESQVVDVQGQTFSKALHVAVKHATPDPWDVQVVVPTSMPVQQGDTIEISFSVRVIAPNDGSAEIEPGFEKADAPYTKSLDVSLSPSANWQRIDLPFRCLDNEPAGGAHLHIVLGLGRQTVELGGFSAVDYGPNIDPKTLPSFELTYGGRALDAPWRKEADARIDRLRKGDISVDVVDIAGHPVPQASVHIAMTRHAFNFGTAVDNQSLFASSDDNSPYRRNLLMLFNKATVENELKWDYWYGTPDHRQLGLNMVAWFNAHNIAVRGHNLVWPSWAMSPPQLKIDFDTREQAQNSDAARSWLESTIAHHITDEVGTLRGKVVSWDVINEPIWNHDFMDMFGEQAMVRWFQAAHIADPGARLFLNDDGTFYGQASPTHIAALKNVLSYLVVHHAPLGGIGLESHFGGGISSMDQIQQSLNDYAKYHVPLEITEYDFKTDDKHLQADYTRDFLTMCFSNPAVHSFVMWGFWDAAHWLGDSPIFYKDWSLKPSGTAFEDLVFHKWWTDQTGSTDRDGIYQARGFQGSYNIIVSLDGSSKIIHTTIRHGANTFVITL